MKRILVLSFAIGFGSLAFADTANACHHRRHRRCGGCGDGGYVPAYYDGKGGVADPAADGVPAPPPPPPPPAPRAT